MIKKVRKISFYVFLEIPSSYTFGHISSTYGAICQFHIFTVLQSYTQTKFGASNELLTECLRTGKD